MCWKVLRVGSMRRIVVLALVALLALGTLSWAQVGSSPDNPIYMLLVPSTEGATVEAVGKAIAEDLFNMTGLYIVASLQADYTAMIEAFAASEGDTFGFPTTDQYIRIYERTGGDVSPRLASERYGNDYYFASIYARRDSGIETLDDLNGKIWIYNETGSTSGYVLPHDVFEASGIQVGSVVESGGHTNSMVALIEGQGDFCTGYGSPPLPPAEGPWAGQKWIYGIDPEMWIWDSENDALYPEEERGTCVDLRSAVREIYDFETVLTDIGVVMTMGPVPNDCLCFGPGFPEDIADIIVAAIQEHIQTEEGKALWNDSNFYEWTAVSKITDSYYDGYRELLGLPIPKPEAHDFTIWLKSGEFDPEPDLTELVLEQVKGAELNRVHVLLQLYDVPSLETLARLDEQSVQLLGYVPNDAWFASIPTGSEHCGFLEELFGERILRWADVIFPKDRIDPQYLEEGAHDWSRNPDGTFNVVVAFFEDIPADQAEVTLARYGRVKEGPRMLNDWVLTLEDKSIVWDLAKEDGVEWIEEIPPTPVDKNDGLVVNIKADKVWANPYNLDGTGVDIGMWEVDGCPDNNSAKGRSTYTGHDDFYNGAGTSHLLVQEGTPKDHATEVAGVLIGSGYASNRYGNGGTANQWKGVAPGAEVYSYTWDDKVTEEHNGAINNKGIDLSQNSWGWADVKSCSATDLDAYNLESKKYDEIVTGIYTRTIPIVFAAGNEQTCTRTTGGWHTINRGGPTAKNTITVGAINSNNNTLDTDSSLGPTQDGRIKPDLVAPGCQTGGDKGIKTSTWSTTALDKYESVCGTSFATPAVSGSIALLIQDYRAKIGGDPLPSAVKALLICTARDLGNKGPDYKFGFGAIDIKAAIDMLRAKQFKVDSVKHGESNLLDIPVPRNAKKLRVTLVWDDKPAALPVSKALVNDLDLVLWEPRPGRRNHYSWKLDPKKPERTATRGWDSVNNVEQVEVDNPTAGKWTIRINAFSIPDRKSQKYTVCWDVK